MEPVRILGAVRAAQTQAGLAPLPQRVRCWQEHDDTLARPGRRQKTLHYNETSQHRECRAIFGQKKFGIRDHETIELPERAFSDQCTYAGAVPCRPWRRGRLCRALERREIQRYQHLDPAEVTGAYFAYAGAYATDQLLQPGRGYDTAPG